MCELLMTLKKQTKLIKITDSIPKNKPFKMDALFLALTLIQKCFAENFNKRRRGVNWNVFVY